MKCKRFFNAFIASTIIISSFFFTLQPEIPAFQEFMQELIEKDDELALSHLYHYKTLGFCLFGVLVRIAKEQADYEGKAICPLFDSETVMCHPLWPQSEADSSITADVIASDESLLSELDPTGEEWANLSCAICNFVENITCYIQPIPAGIALFNLLRAQGCFKIFILSNLPAFCLTKRSCLNDIFEASDGVVLSCDVKHRKPNREIYLDYLDLAERKFGIPRGEGNHLFFDDRECNLFGFDKRDGMPNGAASVGIHGIFFPLGECCFSATPASLTPPSQEELVVFAHFIEKHAIRPGKKYSEPYPKRPPFFTITFKDQ